MTAGDLRLRVRAPSRALQRAAIVPDRSDTSVRRRVGWIWGLLYLNVLPYYSKSPVLHLPTSVGKIITQGALIVAVLLAVSINRKAVVRPNLFLFLMTLLCITSVMMSVRGYFGFSSMLRAIRLVLDVGVLWLLTPWWGRDDLLFLRFHRRALYVVLAVVLSGIVLAPGPAFAQAGGHRLGGAIWPIPPTQVAHYAAILGGTTVVLWFTELIKTKTAAMVTIASVAIIVLAHTRTALVAFLLAVLAAGLSLYLGRQRVRKVIALVVVIGGLVALSFAPFFTSWALRGETSKTLDSLNGRTKVWTAVAAQPSSELHVLFGYGMSTDGFDGRPIDSSWYSAYLDQGLFGDVIDAAILLLLLLIALAAPRGPRRAVAIFLVVYCGLASITETGLGEASPYVLDLAVAMSLLMTPALGPARDPTPEELVFH